MGWKQSGGVIVPASVGIVYRLLERRKAGAWPGLTGPLGEWRRRWVRRARAGTRPAPTGPFGGILLAGHLTLATLLGKIEHGGLVRAGRCGGAAPAQERAEGPNAQMQWSVVSGQWSVTGRFFGDGSEDWRRSGRYQGYKRVRPYFGKHPNLAVYLYYWATTICLSTDAKRSIEQESIHRLQSCPSTYLAALCVCKDRLRCCQATGFNSPS